MLRTFAAGARPQFMPDNATDVAVLRIVVREGPPADLARPYDDAVTALAALDKVKPGGH